MAPAGIQVRHSGRENPGEAPKRQRPLGAVVGEIGMSFFFRSPRDLGLGIAPFQVVDPETLGQAGIVGIAESRT
jgi:hypothetical protein